MELVITALKAMTTRRIFGSAVDWLAKRYFSMFFCVPRLSLVCWPESDTQLFNIEDDRCPEEISEYLNIYPVNRRSLDSFI